MCKKRNPDKFFIEAVTEKTPVIQRDLWGHSKGIELLEHYGCVWIVNLYGLFSSLLLTWKTILKWYSIINWQQND